MKNLAVAGLAAKRLLSDGFYEITRNAGHMAVHGRPCGSFRNQRASVGGRDPFEQKTEPIQYGRLHSRTIELRLLLMKKQP